MTRLKALLCLFKIKKKLFKLYNVECELKRCQASLQGVYRVSNMLNNNVFPKATYTYQNTFLTDTILVLMERIFQNSAQERGLLFFQSTATKKNRATYMIVYIIHFRVFITARSAKYPAMQFFYYSLKNMSRKQFKEIVDTLYTKMNKKILVCILSIVSSQSVNC